MNNLIQKFKKSVHKNNDSIKLLDLSEIPLVNIAEYIDYDTHKHNFLGSCKYLYNLKKFVLFSGAYHINSHKILSFKSRQVKIPVYANVTVPEYIDTVNYIYAPRIKVINIDNGISGTTSVNTDNSANDNNGQSIICYTKNVIIDVIYADLVGSRQPVPSIYDIGENVKNLYIKNVFVMSHLIFNNSRIDTLRISFNIIQKHTLSYSFNSKKIFDLPVFPTNNPTVTYNPNVGNTTKDTIYTNIFDYFDKIKKLCIDTENCDLDVKEINYFVKNFKKLKMLVITGTSRKYLYESRKVINDCDFIEIPESVEICKLEPRFYIYEIPKSLKKLYIKHHIPLRCDIQNNVEVIRTFDFNF